MKKIFKLFLCLLLLVSFTNVTRVLADADDFLDAKVVAENFMKTNFMQYILEESRKENPDVDMEVVIDEEKHEIKLVTGEDVLVTYNYDDEVISYHGIPPQASVDFEYLASEIGLLIYTKNMMLSILDTAGYSELEVYIPDEGEEAVDVNEAFFNKYGLLMKTAEYHFDAPESNCEEDDEVCVIESEEEGEYISEIKLSLDKRKIAALVQEFGVERTDYLGIGKVVKPELTVKKSGSYLNLNWDEDENANNYKVYRSEKKDSGFKKIATVKTNSYTDKKVTYGKTYYYKVKAIGDDNSETSEVIKFKLVPAKVKNVTLSSIKTKSIKVSYDKQNESGYVIERSKDQKKWTTVKTVTSSKTLSYNDTGLKDNTKYYYRVKAYKKVGSKKVYGSYSDVVSARTAPAKPSISIKADTYHSLKLTLTTSKGATKYYIYRSETKNGSYNKIGETTATTYVDDELVFGQTYYYKAKACNSDNKCSDNSSVVSKKVEIKKPSITLTAEKTSPVKINVTGLNEVDGFVVYRSTSKNGTYTNVGTISDDENTFVDATAKKNKIYYYKVRSFIYWNDSKKYSAYSDIKSIKNLYEVPKEETAVPKEALSVLEFVGVYKKGDTTLKIYSRREEQNSVVFSSGHAGASYDMEFENGELVFEDEFESAKIQRAQGEGNRVIVTGVGLDLDGVYTGLREYTTEEYFLDHFGTTDYMNTEYNGKFTNEQDEVIYLYQKDEETVFIEGMLNYNGGYQIGLSLELSEDKTVATYWDLELTVENGVATIKQYEGGELVLTRVLNKVEDLTIDSIVENFNR